MGRHIVVYEGIFSHLKLLGVCGFDAQVFQQVGAEDGVEEISVHLSIDCSRLSALQWLDIDRDGKGTQSCAPDGHLRGLGEYYVGEFFAVLLAEEEVAEAVEGLGFFGHGEMSYFVHNRKLGLGDGLAECLAVG